MATQELSRGESSLTAVSKTGWCQKESQWLKVWRARWLVLSGDALRSYSREGGDALGDAPTETFSVRGLGAVLCGYAPAVLLLGAPTPEFASYVHAAKERKLAKDGPLSAAQDAVLQAMLPALSRTLAAAPPRCTPQEVTSLCLEEWVRECADELMRQSLVLSELCARDGVHVERAVCGSDGALAIL